MKFNKILFKDSKEFKKHVKKALKKVGLWNKVELLGNVMYIITKENVIVEMKVFFKIKSLKDYNYVIDRKKSDKLYKKFNLVLYSGSHTYVTNDNIECEFTIQLVDKIKEG